MTETFLPTVSIIVPTRNRVEDLRRCLECLAKQAYAADRCEILVVDDGSTAETAASTAEVRDRFAASGKTLLYLPNRGQGVNSAVNTGLRFSRGDVIVTVGDDTLPPPQWLEALVCGLIESNAEAVSGPLKIPTPGPLVGKHREEVAACLTEVLAPFYWSEGRVIPVAGNMAVWRQVYQRGVFDASVKAPVEEIDWVLKNRVSAAFVPEAWAWHNKSDEALRLGNVLKIAWRRGSEGGWWLRERLKIPFGERLRLVVRALRTCVRALGHAAIRGCWGGVVVSSGELAKALALAGLINRGNRLAES
jgi:glycosyltransferase involved in cell wall biosynthesis